MINNKSTIAPPPEKLYVLKNLNFDSNCKNRGFTLAETLITLGIIGVVASLTMPALIQNYKKNVVVTKLKQTYTILKSAEQSAILEYGEVENWFPDYPPASDGNFQYEFAEKYYKPFLKSIPCQNKNSILASDGSVALEYYWIRKEFCLPNGSMIYSYGYSSNHRYGGMKIFVDINGNQKPNILGRDVFTFFVGNPKMRQQDIYYYVDCPIGLSTCAPWNFYLYTQPSWDADRNKLIQTCKKSRSETNSCAHLIEINGWEIPDDYPVKL